MRSYKNEFSEEVKMIFNSTEYSDKKIKIYMAIYQKLIKYMDNSTRQVTRKSCEIYQLIKMDWENNQHRKCFSYDYFKKIIKDLERLGLVLLSKIGRYQKVFIPKITSKITCEKPVETSINTDLKGNTNELNYFNINKNYNTNTLLQKIKSLYKGIRKVKYATKKELKDIAKAVMVNYKIDDPELQNLILNKVHNSKQKINIQYAVNYMETLVVEKLIEFDCERTGGTFRYKDPEELYYEYYMHNCSVDF